jgi:ubiquinone/menaquinone biosynthesis C-methylase UbiE
MTKTNERDVYEEAKVSISTGEIEEWDSAIFPSIIRKKLIALIKANLHVANPRMILDYGCGGGWLSKLLSEWGFNVVGVDISVHLLKNAKSVCPKASYIVADAEKLPFRDAVFDYLVGISVLHHLNLQRSCSELRRISTDKADFAFEEPNLLNPFSEIGRKFFPLETCTKGERPFVPSYFEKALNGYGFCCRKIFYLYFIAFPLARLFKIANKVPPSFMINMLLIFENLMSDVPYIRRLNASIFVVGEINQSLDYTYFDVKKCLESDT